MQYQMDLEDMNFHPELKHCVEQPDCNWGWTFQSCCGELEAIVTILPTFIRHGSSRDRKVPEIDTEDKAAEMCPI
jgi:hypothetical protein